MTTVGERLLWFVLGVVAGFVLARFFARKPRQAIEPPTPVPDSTHSPASLPAVAETVPQPSAIGPSPSRMIDVGAARACGFNMKHAEDLTIIEGIGPKIDDLLRAGGIESFVQLAQLRVDDLLDLLERGGPNFRLANPANWAQQALLAAENRWIELKQLQAGMIGGDAHRAD
jgi:predicted flap endonuclease-1-like 5' DNA nuclease